MRHSIALLLVLIVGMSAGQGFRCGEINEGLWLGQGGGAKGLIISDSSWRVINMRSGIRSTTIYRPLISLHNQPEPQLPLCIVRLFGSADTLECFIDLASKEDLHLTGADIGGAYRRCDSDSLRWAFLRQLGYWYGVVVDPATPRSSSSSIDTVGTAVFERGRGRYWPPLDGVTMPPDPPPGRDFSGPGPGYKLLFTALVGDTVRTIAAGEVTSVIQVPEAGHAVIVQHGRYRSVYSGIGVVYVTKGTVLEERGILGSALAAGGDKSVVFELWWIDENGALDRLKAKPWFRVE